MHACTMRMEQCARCGRNPHLASQLRRTRWDDTIWLGVRLFSSWVILGLSEAQCRLPTSRDPSQQRRRAGEACGATGTTLRTAGSACDWCALVESLAQPEPGSSRQSAALLCPDAAGNAHTAVGCESSGAMVGIGSTGATVAAGAPWTRHAGTVSALSLIHI